MKFKTWLEAVNNQEHDQWTKDKLIQEAPHTRFGGSLPPELSFLSGSFVDLGFENLGLSAEKQRTLYLAFSGTGLSVPGTHLKLRHPAPGQSGVEVADGSEIAFLPKNWKQAVFVMNNDDQFTWIGKLVRQEQVGDFDKSKYREVPDGWELEISSLS
jgi:hypothetical protein